MKRQGVNEDLLCRIWKGQQFIKDRLVASSGQWLQVVYPGRVNGDSGPDFCGAIIADEAGGLMKGDIELHVRASDWRAHGHHHDPRFNRVILHVVMWDDTGRPAQLQNGATTPSLALYNCLQGSLEDLCQQGELPRFSLEPCYTALERWGDTKVRQVLEDAGEERFRAKAALFEAGLAVEEPQQVLYEGVMEALGYSKNKEPFLELARRLPLQVVEGFVQGKPPQRQLLVSQALLFGVAGLLPSQRPSKTVNREALRLAEEMECIWRSFGSTECMRENDWRFFRVRPDNLPSRRLAAAGHLVVRYMEKGLVEGILGAVTKGAVTRVSGRLEQSLMVTDSGYWARHADLVGEARALSSSLIGRGRARDIIVNIILPFSFAWAQVTSSPRLAQQALEFYQHYPKLEDNDVTREMKNKLFGGSSSGGSSSAQRQQGLIYLFKTFCLERRCSECILS